MKVNDGSGLGTKVPSKQALSAFEDAEPRSSKESGQGESGSGTKLSAGRMKPLSPGGSKKD